MGIEEIWDNYTSSERDMFQRSCRRLLKQTFIVRDRDDISKRTYFFIAKNTEPFSIYLGYIGFDIVLDRENGVIMLRNCRDISENSKLQINHIKLKKAESIVLCCLWTMYIDRVRSGNLSKNITITITELQFELEKYNVKSFIDKSTMTSILALFSQYQLLQVFGKVGEEDCRICLYPSMQFALDSEEFKKFTEIAKERIKKWNDETDILDEDKDYGETLE